MSVQKLGHIQADTYKNDLWKAMDHVEVQRYGRSPFILSDISEDEHTAK